MNSTLEFLYSLRNQGSKFGIERMELFCRELGNPQDTFPSIHVAGTNGKGSVCTMLDKIYRDQGYRVGLFTSPHLIELGERIRVNGKILSFGQIEKWVEILLPITQEMQKKEEGMGPTFFEFITAIAFLEFQKQKVDLAIIETGLGGRLDSTNVLNPEVSIITTVGLDHCELLGHTLREIAAEKAGIIKKAKPVVVGWLEKEARDEVLTIAGEKKAEIYRMDEWGGSALPSTNLKGSFQQKNAAIAQQAAELLNHKFPLSKSKVQQSLLTVEFPGRWQKISTEPAIIVDACHNGQGARESVQLWNELPNDVEIWFAACGEDRAVDVLTPLLQFTQKITLFELQQSRTCTHAELQKIVSNFTGLVNCAQENEIPQLLQKLNPQSTLLVTGSIYLVGALLSHFKESKNSLSQENWQDNW
jgi:dihydrofolate synthase/folylpolyglutamate synthase